MRRFNDRKVYIGFLGSNLDFSKRLLDLAKLELEGVQMRRFETLEDVREITSDPKNSIRILIVAESRAEDMIARYRNYTATTNCEALVLAYEDPGHAKTVRLATLQSKETSGIRFLPMRCSVDVWLSLLKILYYRQDVLPQELLLSQGEQAPSLPRMHETSGAVSILTSREDEILRKVAKGLKNKSIADDLRLSEHTVKLHLHNAFVKIGVPNRAAAAAWYLSRGLND